MCGTLFMLQDVADGVSSLLLGRLPSSQQPLVLVGGNCSIQGFDAAGAERCGKRVLCAVIEVDILG